MVLNFTEALKVPRAACVCGGGGGGGRHTSASRRSRSRWRRRWPCEGQPDGVPRRCRVSICGRPSRSPGTSCASGSSWTEVYAARGMYGWAGGGGGGWAWLGPGVRRFFFSDGPPPPPLPSPPGASLPHHCLTAAYSMPCLLLFYSDPRRGQHSRWRRRAPFRRHCGCCATYQARPQQPEAGRQQAAGSRGECQWGRRPAPLCLPGGRHRG